MVIIWREGDDGLSHGDNLYSSVYQPKNAHIISYKTLLKHFKSVLNVFYEKLYVHSLVDKLK